MLMIGQGWRKQGGHLPPHFLIQVNNEFLFPQLSEHGCMGWVRYEIEATWY